MIDTQTSLQTSTTQAATFSGTPLALNTGTPRRGMWARVIYSAATSTSTNTALFSVDLSYDSGSTWQARFYTGILNLTVTSQAGERWIYFSIATQPNGIPPQIRATCTIAGAGTASVTYFSDLAIARP